MSETLRLTESQKPRRHLLLVGAGMELAACFMVPTYIGYSIDRYFHSEIMWRAAVGGLLGFAFGMYNLVRLTKRL